MKKKNEKVLVPQCLSNLVPFKRAFTLAEVLITLGVIGVVASMTIPTLMVDINTRQWSTAAVVFEKKLNESLKTMNTQQTIAGHTTTLSFVNELSKNFKINKICKNNELQNCFPETVYWGAGEATPEEVDMTTIKQASHFGLDDWGTELIGVQFANGVTGLVAYNPACSGDPYSNQFNGSGCISMLYDTSGDKNPNTSGKDLGNYGVIHRLGGAICTIELDGICFGAPFKPTAVSFAECETIKDSLGIQECYHENDHWVGAVKQCGGVDKLASPQNIAVLAKYLYNTDINICTQGNPSRTCSTDNINLDIEKAFSLGFNDQKLYADKQIFFMTNEIHLTYDPELYGDDLYVATDFTFNEHGTIAGITSPNYGNAYTLCINN